MGKLIWMSFLSCPLLLANEALDLLDAELPGSGQVYLDSVDPPKEAETEKKKKTVPSSLNLVTNPIPLPM